MRRWIFLVSVLCLLPAASGTARSEVFMDYNFPDGVVWAVDGFEVYDIMQRGEVVGEARIDYGQITMMDAPAYRLEWTQTWTSGEEPETEISVDAKLRASDLKALMTTRIERVGDQEWRYEGNYTGQSMEFTGYYPGETEPEEASLTRSGDFCDLDTLPFALRNIPFEDGNFVTLTVVDVTTASSITPIASVRGSEIVETANTQYDCWVVNVSLGGREFTAWYSKNDSHYLVRLRYSDRDMVLNHHS